MGSRLSPTPEGRLHLSDLGPDQRRIVVLGVTGSGKTTLAGQISRRLNIPHIEIDSLYWGPNWADPDEAVFQERLRQATLGDAWVLDGSYSRTRPITWPRLHMAVWIDYELPLILWRLFWRTVRRTVMQEELWSGNRERFAAQFLSRESLFLWAIKTHPRRREQYKTLFGEEAYSHIQLVHLHTPRETQRWLDEA